MTFNSVKNILFIGNYHENYNRNAIFIKGLKKHNIRVHEFNVKSFNIIRNTRFIFKSYKKIISLDYDLILLHSPTILQIIFAKFLSKTQNVPLIHDIFISKLQTFYYDRILYDRNKMPKFFYKIFYYLQDFFECVISDYILLDTYIHIIFFHKKFNVPLKKFRRVIVGAQDDIFHPLKKEVSKNEKFVVGFWGTFIPVHGIEYIIKSAKILEKDKQIQFILVGKGQTYKESKDLVKNLNISNVKLIPKNFMEHNQLKELAKIISDFDIGLGIFGESVKVSQVIPTKIYEGIAMKIPIITCDSPAIKELFKNYELAEVILKLKNDIELREKIKENSYIIFKKHCTIDVIGKRLVGIFNKILKN
jgi:glycosyltransferase involved in cell wall biosynthesis